VPHGAVSLQRWNGLYLVSIPSERLYGMVGLPNRSMPNLPCANESRSSRDDSALGHARPYSPKLKSPATARPYCSSQTSSPHLPRQHSGECRFIHRSVIVGYVHSDFVVVDAVSGPTRPTRTCHATPSLTSPVLLLRAFPFSSPGQSIRIPRNRSPPTLQT
jgi:hypothetical protein